MFLILNISLFTTLNDQNEKPNYNAALADSLGADEYGMKHYYLIILKTGTAKIEDKTIVNQLFKCDFLSFLKLNFIIYYKTKPPAKCTFL